VVGWWRVYRSDGARYTRWGLVEGVVPRWGGVKPQDPGYDYVVTDLRDGEEYTLSPDQLHTVMPAGYRFDKP
jgi:hypothetical protein